MDLVIPCRSNELHLCEKNMRGDSNNTAIIEIEQPKDIDAYPYLSDARLKGVYLTWDGDAAAALIQ